jgi:ubiquitin-activating enzyme E1 C
MYPCVSGCFECTLNLFPPQQAVPLCTIAETPRNAAHCVLYAHLIEAPKEFGEEKKDKDDPAYQQWVFEKAAARASQFSISGVTLMQTQGVIKNIIPAIASTNAIVAAACANEVFKVLTNSSAYLNNNLMYIGGQGVYAPTFKYERNPECIVCGAGIVMEVPAAATLTALMELMHADTRLRLKAPSIGCE